MAASWCAALASASFDVVFYKEGALSPDIDYTLVDFEAPLETYQYVARVSVHQFHGPLGSTAELPTSLRYDGELTLDVLILTFFLPSLDASYTRNLTLISSDGLGQRHTILRDAVALQTVTYSYLLPAFSNFHGKAEVCAMGHTWI